MTHRRSHATGILAALTVLATLALATFTATALAAPPEKPNAESATGVSATEAILHGELNPGASSEEVEYHFTYGTGGSCEGTNAPEPPLTASGNHTKVSQPVTGLTPNSEYLSCLVATTIGSEPESETSEPSAIFKTASLAPAIDAESSSNVTPIKATLEAQVNANNETTSCKFEYGETTAYGETVNCEPETLEGFGDQGVSVTAASLTPSTTYHFRVVVENATGETQGTDTEFTTPAKEVPLIDSESVSGITPFTATLEAQINPDDQNTTFAFEYATNEALSGATVVPGEFELSGFGDQGASVGLIELTRGTTYFYRATAENETGPATPGPVQSFTTIGLPSVDDVAPTATNITHRQARLAGTVNPGGVPATFHFDYGTTAAYGLSTPEESAGEGAVDAPVGPQTISELQPATTYHYRLVAVNSAGTNPGADHTFTTGPALPPLVATGPASGVGSSSATISGTLDSRGLPGSYEFDVGVDTSYGSRIFGASGEAAETVTLGLSNLTPGTTYHYRLCASNEDGSACGGDQTFSTPGFAFPLPGVTPSALVSFPASILAQIAAAQAKPVTGSTPGPAKPLSKAQKRAKALKACNKKVRHVNRKKCEKEARVKYGSRGKKVVRKK